MALRQNAIEHKKSHPLACQVTLDDFYVDDCLTGRDTVEDVVELVDELLELSALGGFTLRKFKLASSKCWLNCRRIWLIPNLRRRSRFKTTLLKSWGWNGMHSLTASAL